MRLMQKLRDVNVSKRMTISFGIVTGLSCVATLLAIIMMWIINAKYSEAMQHDGFIQGDIGRYTTYLNEERILIRDIVMLNDADTVAAKKTELAAADEKIALYFQSFYDKLETKEEQALVQNMITNLEKYHALRKEIISLE